MNPADKRIYDRLRKDERTEEIFHEAENGWWLWLNPGWEGVDGKTTMREDTLTELAQTFDWDTKCTTSST